MKRIDSLIFKMFTFCIAVTALLLTACTTEDDISNSAAAVVIPLNTGDISQAVAE